MALKLEKICNKVHLKDYESFLRQKMYQMIGSFLDMREGWFQWTRSGEGPL